MKEGEQILSALSGAVTNSVYIAPLTAFYTVGLETLPYPEKVAPVKLPDKHAKRITKDFVGTTLHTAVQVEALVDLLIKKGIITDDEFQEQCSVNLEQFAERKRQLHQRYFLGIMETL